MRIKLQQLETDECITVEEAKLHCRVDIDDEDDWFTANIIAARQFVEKSLDGAVLPQTLIAYYDFNEASCFKRTLKLPSSPIISIASIKSYDSENSETVFSSSNYFLSGDRIALNDNASWPSDLRTTDSVAIEFMAGFGAENDEEEMVATVPEDIKKAMLFLIAHWYQNREAVYDPLAKFEAQKENIPFSIRAILMAYRRFIL